MGCRPFANCGRGKPLPYLSSDLFFGHRFADAIVLLVHESKTAMIVHDCQESSHNDPAQCAAAHY